MIQYDQGEKIKLVLKRYSLAFTLETLFLIIAAILPYIAYRSGLSLKVYDLFGVTKSPLFLNIGLYMLWLLFVWILFFIAWSDYYLDVWIITDGRVIDVEQYGMFRRRINYYRLDRVREVELIKTKGLAKVFNYGTLLVKMEGEQFIIEEVKEPEKIKDLILNERREILSRLNRNMEFEAGK
ncbi:MAG TPA: hypothetical protein VFA52_02045 [Candidatus Paceibacterota bacterium]|nr:hypothetical protein [Candidatus Paceibacterota bacterium]